MRRICATILAVEKQQVITHSECVHACVGACMCVWACVALGIQHVMCMHHIVIYGLSGSTIFSTLFHKQHDFQKKSYWMQLIDFFYKFAWKSVFIVRKIEWDMIKNVYWFQVKYPLFLSNFNESWISTDFRKILKFHISQKCIWWEPSCYMWTDRHINRHDIACCRL